MRNLDVKVELVDGQYHDVDSSALAFEIAARAGFRELLQKCKPVLLEPIMKLEITTPPDNLGDITGDLLQRRAMITETSQRGRNTILHAEAPLANLFGYSTAIRGLSQGRASCSMEPSAYGPAPQDVVDTFLL